MRLRIEVDVTLERRKPAPAAPAPAAPSVDAKASAHVEHAGPQRIGFEVPRTMPRWWDDEHR